MLSSIKQFLVARAPTKSHSQHTLTETAATHVSIDTLIQLQHNAKKLNLSRQSYANTSTAGAHRSRFRGRGMDYQESRIYQAGDDIRNMDWRITARSGKPHTKLYQEERERPVVFLIDFSPSLFFGSVNTLKSVLTAKAATLIAWAIARKGDRIGALIINPYSSQKGHVELPPKMGKRGVLQLINALKIHSDPQHLREKSGTQATADTNHLNEELKRLRHIARPGSLIFIISDFYQLDPQTEHHLQRLSQHNDIQAIQIVDPLELTPPPPDLYHITDGVESGVLNTRSKQQRLAYERYFRTHHTQLKAMMTKHHIPLLTLSTANDVLLSLQQYFSQSKKRVA